MDKALRPSRFDEPPTSNAAAKDFIHWLKTFESYLDVLPQDGLDKLKVLINFISPRV